MDEVSEQVLAEWGGPELREFWASAREALESPRRADRFSAALPDDATRAKVSEVYGRPLYAEHSRIMVSKLDKQLRENTRFGLGLAEVLEILHGRPVEPRAAESADSGPRDRTGELARAALAEHGLAGTAWAEPWISWLPQYGRVAEDVLERVLRQAAAALSRMRLDPAAPEPASYVPRAELAASAGGPHELDSGTTLSRVVLRAAATAHGVDSPGNERERWALWERCGVAADSVSATVPCWALPLLGEDEWSRNLVRRTEMGLPAHLTHADLALAPERLVEPGAVIAVCENPRVLEAAAQEGIRHPVIALSERPSTAALSLLARLRADGAELHHHGDFDWPGVALAARLRTERGVRPWRMAATDYREAVNLAAAERLDLPPLVGSPVDTPWDPDLAELMATASRAVDEEIVLPTLLADLRDGALG